MEICFITDFYPTTTNQACVFVKKLICAIADKGIICKVISPQILMPDTLKQKLPEKRVEYTENGSKIEIYMPIYVHLSSSKRMMKISMYNHFCAAYHTLKKNNIRPDYVYGHFLYQNGITAARIGQKLGIPSYCACGENCSRLEKNSEPFSTGLKYGKWKDWLNLLNGIVSVSEYNKRLLIENGFVDASKRIAVCPNAVDKDAFHTIDRKTIRKKLGFPIDAFIVAFNGSFSSRKGYPTLCNVLNKMDDVYSIFIGSSEKPDCDNVLFSGKLDNKEIPQYLNAADIFVLPTRAEGCSNAIVEALACGLPVISSNRAFNDGLLDMNNSITLDETDEESILKAINELKKNKKLRTQLSEGAIKSTIDLDIKVRAQKIVDFMKECEHD